MNLRNMFSVFKKITSKPLGHILFLMILILAVVLMSDITILKDGNSYQNFIEKAAGGQIDFSISGFHGADFLGVPIYWLTGSPATTQILDIILAIFSVPLFYLLGKEVFKSKKAGIFLAYSYVLMPLQWLDMFRGCHQAAFLFFFVLGLYLLVKNSFWSWLPIGFSYIIKPYAIFACPFFLYKKRYKEFFLSLLIPAIYLFFQIGQAGRIIIGDHPDQMVENILSLKKFGQYLIYAIQNIFSVHNYSPFNNVYLSDMSQVSVILVFLAIMAIFNHKKYFVDKKLARVIFLSAVLGLAGACLLPYLDMARLVVFYVMIPLLAWPLLEEYKFFVPLTVGISGFQFYYAYLFIRGDFWPTGNIFLLAIWALIFIISIVYYFFMIKDHKEERLRICA